MKLRVFLPAVLALLFVAGCNDLGPMPPDEMSTPSLALRNGGMGINIAAGGVGLFSQPGTFSLNVPVANSADILEAYFYWAGRSYEGTPDLTIVINSTEYTGELRDSYLVNGGTRTALFYRLDALAHGLVNPGANSYTVSGFDHGTGGQTDGIGLAVIYADPASEFTDIVTIEPNEFVYHADPDYPQGVVHTLSFPATTEARDGRLVVFVGDCKPGRPDRLWWVVGSGTPPGYLIGGPYSYFEDEFVSANGAEMDVFDRGPVPIPAGADYFAYQLESPPLDNGDSFLHTFAALCIPGPPVPALECRVTGGGVDTFGDWNGEFAKGKSGRGSDTNRYQFGGQAGAPTASQPQPYGEWTHHQQNGPDGSFLFHAGTASAPQGTEIDLVVCSDPGFCSPAREAPAKQIDFEGVGTFKNIRNPSPSLSGVVPGETFHWFEVHIEDLGEPGKGGKQPPPASTCPEEGSAGAVAECDCPDFYRITIYEGVPAGQTPSASVVIYEVYGYITGGNLQIHPPIH